MVVLDNLREGVLTPDIYDPALNPLYRDVLAHYGAVALPCRVRDPDRKGKVETGVGHAQKTPLKGLRFETSRRRRPIWITGKRAGPTRASTAPPSGRSRRCSPRSGRPAAAALEPFRYYQYGERTVHLDGCVEVEAAYYARRRAGSAARLHGAVGRPARAPARSADRPAAARAPAPDARPPSHPRRGPAAEARRRRRCNCCSRRHAGTHIGALCRRDASPTTASSACAASSACCRWPRSTAPPPSTSLRRRAGDGRCRLPLRAPLPRAQPALPLALRQVDPLIRQLTLYRDLIDHKTKEIPE